MTTAIWWVRRDLRLSDNQALAEARARAETVAPVFIMDPAILAAPDIAPARVAFLWDGLRQLDADLRARGSRLIIRRGEPAEALAGLRAECDAAVICAEADGAPYGRQRDARVAETLPLRLAPGLTVHPPEAVLKADGKPFTVYTPFGRRWRALPPPAAPLPAPPRLAPPPDLFSLPIPTEPAGAPFPAGEAEAARRLAAFAAGPLADYATERDRLDHAGTSALSPYLRFGMLSARQAAVAARQAGSAGAEVWLSELIGREFYMSILTHFPDGERDSFRAGLRAIAWDNDAAAFAAWREGRTGYPVVDAALRQLAGAGWTHNRARMIAASFLVKDLLIDWRWGERWFMQNLVDGEPASNNGGWQWTAGVGTDAAPYFRVFNPTLQGQKFDPEGAYVRRWVPELAGVPTRFIHAPWKMSEGEQTRAGCRIGKDYPAPMVDHARARARVMEVYGRAGR